MAMTDAQVQALLSESHVSVIGTVDASGKPAQSPVWHLWEDGVAYVLTSRASRKWKNLLGNPNASLCVGSGFSITATTSRACWVMSVAPWTV